MISGIYKLQSIKYPNRIYIGSAKNLKQRERQHKKDLVRGKHCNKILQHHVNKYGLDDLGFSILEYCDIAFLIKNEQKYFDLLNPHFNICKVAGSTLGRPQSEYTKKLRVANRVKKWNGVWKHSEETKAKLSLLQKIRYGDSKKKTLLKNKIERRIIKHVKLIDKAFTYSNLPREPILKIRVDNSSGFHGVTFDKPSQTWRARIKHKGKLLDAGRYATASLANEGRLKKKFEIGLINSIGV